MRRVAALFLFLAALFACSTASAATGNRLRLVYIPNSNPVFPGTQTVAMGAATRVGFGGSPLGYANPIVLGVSRWLGITSQVDKDSAPVTVFTLDERNMLVPTNAGAAITSTNYGTAWTSAHANGPYTVTVAEYIDAARTIPTGATTTITVPVSANVAHVREATSAVNGCLKNCATIKPDGCLNPPTCTTFNSTINQLNTTVTTGTSLTGGGTVVLRDAGTTTVSPTPFNPLDQEYRIRPLATYAGGSGRITFVSETVDNGPDAYGNPFQNKNGFQFGGGLKMDTAVSGDVNIPVDMTHMWCYVTSPTALLACFQWASNTTGTNNSGLGSGVNLSYIRFEESSTAKLIEGAKWHTAATMDHNYCINIDKCLLSAGNTTVTDNIGTQLPDDFIDIGYCGNDVERNWSFDWAGLYPDHGDFIQHNAPTLGNFTCDYGTVAYNFEYIPNYQLNRGDSPQGHFQRELASLGNFYENANFSNNILLSQAANMLYIARHNAPSIKYSTILQHFSSGQPFTGTGSISGSTLTITAVSQGSVTVGMSLANTAGGTCDSLPPYTSVRCGQYVVAQLTGSAGGIGTYTLGLTQDAIASQAINSVQTSAIVQVDPIVGDGTQGTNLTVLNTVTNAYNFSRQNGIITLTNAQTMTASAANNTTAFPAWTQGSNPGVRTRAALITALAPALGLAVASGGVMNPDGSYNGALFPANDAGDICWNNGAVFDHTKTCAQLGTTKAQ